MKPDRIYFALISLIIFTTISWISSCTHETDSSNIPEICFKDVYAIIGPNCVRGTVGMCHNVNSEAVNYTIYINIYDAVVPGDPDKSPLYKAITTIRGENKMPPDGPIAEESRSTIRFWIEQGAVDSTQNSQLCNSSKGIAGTGSENSLNIK